MTNQEHRNLLIREIEEKIARHPMYREAVEGREMTGGLNTKGLEAAEKCIDPWLQLQIDKLWMLREGWTIDRIDEEVRCRIEECGLTEEEAIDEFVGPEEKKQIEIEKMPEGPQKEAAWDALARDIVMRREQESQDGLIFSEKWFEEQREQHRLWQYEHRWELRWDYIQQKLKVFGQYLGVAFLFLGLPIILALVLHKVFGVYENLALPLLCIIGFALLVSYGIGKHYGKKSHPVTEPKNDDFYERRRKYQEKGRLEKERFENLEKEIDKMEAEVEEIERKSKLYENQNKGITHP